MAADLASARSREEELLAALQKQQAEFQRQMQQMQLDWQIQAASMAPAAPQPPGQALPKDLSPTDPVTFEQFAVMAGNLPALVEIHTTRATWGISPQEEQQILAEYPNLVQMPELQRVRLMKQVADMKRSAPAAAPPAPNGRQATPQQRPITQHVVPHVEGGTPPVVSEPHANDQLQLALKAYEDAKQIPDKRKRHLAMRQTWDRVLAIQGVSHADLSKTAWVSKS
jgi:hypothetical protein